MPTTNGRDPVFPSRLRTDCGGIRRSSGRGEPVLFLAPAIRSLRRGRSASSTHPGRGAAGGGSWASIAAVSCLAGAVDRDGRGARHPARRQGGRPWRHATAALQPITSVVWRQFPTERVATQVTPSVARLDILGPKGWQQPASAVLLNNDGTLVTSAELVHGSRKLVVTFADDLPVPVASWGSTDRPASR